MSVAIDDLAFLYQFLEAAPDAMVVVDAGGTIRLANPQAVDLFGAPLAGKPVEDLVPADARQRHAEHRARYEQAPRTRTMGEGLQLEGVRGNGDRFPVAISLSPITAGGERFTLAAVRDISDQRRQEQRLRESLRQKEVLLKEVHHRVKNNLQIIISLLSLQARAVPTLAPALHEAQARIRSMALVHERLYQTSDVGAVEVAGYLGALVDDLGNGLPENVQIKLDARPNQVDTDTAITLGLIVNELVSNALKHGIGGGGTLWLDVDTRDGIHVVAQDDGPGLPSDLNPRAGPGIGVRLVSRLAEQLGGTATWTSNGGARVEVHA